MASTVALVDDDRNILTSVTMALEAEGFSVHTYGDGEQALRGMRSQPVDLAVLRSEEHTSELQSLMRISYAVFCLKKKTHHHQCNTQIRSVMTTLHTTQ